MTHPFTLLQISDCHLLQDAAGLYRGYNPDQCLQNLLPALKALKPDGLVLTGDVAEDGSIEAYQRVVKHLDGLTERRAFIPGNHDDVPAMREVLVGAGYEAGPIVAWAGWSLALLNSVIHDDPAGALSDEAWQAIEQLPKQSRPALVFVHHPPMLVGSPWIDRYPLRNPEAFVQALDPQWVRAVGFGHIHQSFSAFIDGIQYLSAPATSVNSQAEMDAFTYDPTGPKARWYRLWPEGRWATGVISAG